MSQLDTIVSVQITATTTTPTRRGFGTPLIAAFHTVFPELVRSYSDLDGMVADGFAVTDAAYKAAAAMWSQSPRPPAIKIGRRALAPTQSGEVIPTLTTEGLSVGCTVVHPATGAETIVAYEVQPGDLVSDITAALQPLFDAIDGLDATDNGTDVSVLALSSGNLFDFKSFTGGLVWNDLTADPGIATDLAAIVLEDDDWYALALDSNSKAEIAAAAAWVETRIKIFGANSADYEVLQDTAGNIAETLNDASRARTFLIWSRNVLSYAACAWLGKQLPTDAGSTTWAFKTLSGVVADQLTTTEIGNLESNECNHYMRVAGVDITRQGTAADGDFIDIQRTIDALQARIQEDIYAILVNQPKLPYTDASVNAIKGAIRGALRAFQATGALDPETEPTVTAPLVADVATADRANRLLPDVEFTARLAGAIHKVEIQGTLTV